MTEGPPTSELLPTAEWTDVCRELCDQMGPDDERFVIRDTSADPVANRADDMPPRPES
jgi:hypothetical protein